jgi:hypothetical protein
MHPRPFYRWKSFWFGVLFFLSFQWFSLNSMRIAIQLSWSFGGRPFFLDRFNEQTQLVRGPSSFPAHLEFRTGPRGELPSVGELKAGWLAVGASVWRVRDYAIAGPLFVSWLGWLAWRWRRQKRAHGVTVP